MKEFITDILQLDHEPLISDEDETLLKRITSLERTSHFEELNVSEEKLDELIEKIDNQEDYVGEILNFLTDLEKAPAIFIADNNIDFI